MILSLFFYGQFDQMKHFLPKLDKTSVFLLNLTILNYFFMENWKQFVIESYNNSGLFLLKLAKLNSFLLANQTKFDIF